MSASKKPYRSKKQADKSKSKGQRAVLVGLGVLGVLGFAYLLILASRGPETVASIEDLIKFPRQSREHVEAEIAAGDLPPAGGGHSPVWQNCGIYDEPIPVENALHSLEHGALWLAYQPDLLQEEVEALRERVRGEDYVLMSPYPGLRSPVVLTAWEVQLELDSSVDDRMEAFIEQYQQGPTTPELGASCSDGQGTPLQ
jgi:hypothetical protein